MNLRQYLEQIVQLQGNNPKYYSMAEYVLKHGGPFQTSDPSFFEDMTLRQMVALISPKLKACYRNAMMLWDIDKKFKYAEGFALGSSVPVLHAWNILNEKVVDITWEYGKATYKKGPSDIHLGKGEEYFGVIFSDSFMREHLKRCIKEKQWLSVLDDWQSGFPLLKKQ